MDPQQWQLVALALASVAVLVVLVVKFKVNAMYALPAASAVMAVGAVNLGVHPLGSDGQPVAEAWTYAQSFTAFAQKFWAILSDFSPTGITPIIILGAISGRILASSSGADSLAKGLLRTFGINRAGLCIMALALCVGLSTWFAVGFLLLLPILHSLVRETGRPFLSLALPLLSFLSVMHGVMPPHPGPVVAVKYLHASTGATLIWGMIVGIPVAAVVGPLFARIVSRRFTVTPGDTGAPTHARTGPLAPFGTTLFIILLPILLMMAASAAEIVGGESTMIKVIRTAGAPSLALLLGILAMLTVPSLRPEGSLAPVPGLVRDCIKSVGPTILTVAAGGGFAKVLTTSGLAKILGDLAASANLSIFVYGWLAAAFVRVVTGSATVSITVAAELLVPQLQNSPNTVPELLIVAIGCGSLFFSHLNDAGFWIVKDSLKLSIRDMLRTWTITETLVGVSGLGFTILVSKIRDLLIA